MITSAAGIKGMEGVGQSALEMTRNVKLMEKEKGEGRGVKLGCDVGVKQPAKNPPWGSRQMTYRNKDFSCSRREVCTGGCKALLKSK